MSIRAQVQKEIHATQRARFPRVHFDDAGNIAPNPYLVKGIIDAKSNALLYGPSGGGKTFFAIDLAAHIAAGIPWRGHRVHAGLVVYVACEAGTSILRRFAAWRDSKLGEAHDSRTPLVILTRGANLLDVSDVDALIAELQEIAAELGIPLALVAFDTLSRSIPGGDENSAQDMTQAIAAADRVRDELHAATLFVHHSGKDQTKGARGHSALFAAADTVISVADNVATVEKSRDGESGQTYGFNLKVIDLGADEDGDPLTTCVIEPTDAAPSSKNARPLSATGQIALQALRESIGEHGETTPETSSMPRGVRAVRIERWRTRFALRYGTDGDIKGSAIRMAFSRGKDALIKSGYIAISDPFVWLTS